MEQEKAQEYSDYRQVYQRKVKESKEYIQQLQLLKNYPGCNCGSKEVDAYHLYQASKLICQPCLMSKERGASGSISFLEQQKWYQRYWKIDLTERLEKYNSLPIDANCARKWLKDKEHLNNCQCLEQKAHELYLLFANSLKNSKGRLKKCQCETSPKWRVDYMDSEGSGWIYCEICETRIRSAGHHGVIKNRNDPRFWGLNVKEKALCGDCLESKKENMPPLRRAEFNRYRKVGRL